MSTYPLLRFVSEPSVDAQVRYDLNPTGIKDPAFTYGSVAFAGDPDAISPQLGFRRLSFTHYLQGTKRDCATEQSLLARELLRDRNWLFVQLSPESPPAWFHTYRSPTVAVDFTFVTAYDGMPDLWQLPLSVDADPDIWGAKVSWDTFTVSNDPVDGGCFAVLPEVPGDLPAPLRIVMDAGSDVFAPLVSVAAAETTPEMFAIEAEDFGLAVDDLSTQSSIGASGGEAIRTGAPGYSGTLVYSFTPSTPGRWAVFVRAGGLNQGATMQLAQAVGSDYLLQPAVAKTRQGWAYYRLGDVSAPAGGWVTNLDITGAVPFAIFVVNDDVQLDIDQVVLLPLDCPTSPATARLLAVSDYDSVGLIDGETGAVCSLYQFATDTVPGTTHTQARPAGRPPIVHPGAENRLYLLRTLAWRTIGGPEDDLAATTDVTISFHPRWLFLPGE